MTGTGAMASHGNARHSGTGQQHCCEPCVSWGEPPLLAAQQALPRSGLRGNNISFGFAAALEGATYIPKDGFPCSQETPRCEGEQRY